MSFFRLRSADDAVSLSKPKFPGGLKELYCSDHPTVDICFVHGLAGDRERTWTAMGEPVSWPQSLLPGVLSYARILTFGYDAYAIKKGVAGTNGLLGHATNLLQDLTRDRMRCCATGRPLVFVAHSLGGLVCKKALLLSRDSPQEHHRDVYESVIGIAFMGTPHRGAWTAQWAKIPATALGFSKSKNTKLLDVLCTDNAFLEDLGRSFLQMLDQRRRANRAIEVACFYEEEPLPVVGLVVPEDSATMDDKLPFSIPANHRNMVRFKSVVDPGFDRLLGELQRWTGALGHALELSPGMARVRRSCLESLHFDEMAMRSADVRMATEGTCGWLLEHEQYRRWVDGQGLLLIKGKPGSGKSTLLKYAWTHTDTTDDICLSFFFHGRGSVLQNTPLGFLRSVAHQLLRAAPFSIADLVKSYERNHTQRHSGAAINPSKWVWTEQDLQTYLMTALPNILATRAVWLFVDALDESSEPNDLFRWLQDLLNTARSGNSFPCRFLASCRHYPVLVVKDGVFKICTEDENARDIATYVYNRFENDGFSQSIKNSDIPSRVIDRASGIFLWANWIMGEILYADLCGKRVAAVRSIVEGTPEDLMALYAQQLETTKGDDDNEDFVDLMFWACFSKKPLTSKDLRWAIAMSDACKHESLLACKEAGDVLSTEQTVRYVQSVGRGLLELTPTALQFIHQTAKEFMQTRGLPTLLGNVSPAEAQRLGHFRLAKACVRFLAMRDCSETRTRSFFTYAYISWLYHIEKCDGNDVVHAAEHNELLRLLRWPSIDVAANLAQWVTKYSPPSLVHALASRRAPGLLQVILQHERGKAQVKLRNKAGATPLHIAVMSDSASAVMVLLENGADPHEDYDGNGELAVALAKTSGKTILALAIELQNESVVQALLDYGEEHPSGDGRSSVFEMSNDDDQASEVQSTTDRGQPRTHDFDDGPDHEWHVGTCTSCQSTADEGQPRTHDFDDGPDHEWHVGTCTSCQSTADEGQPTTDDLVDGPDHECHVGPGRHVGLAL